ncbi:hypothetical protein FQN60_016622, partial [Etheostoma spectabile]
MPAGTLERTSPSAVAATPTRVDSTPEKPRSLTENRKSSKPIMEKRRRARINESLGQLKTLILDALKQDSSRHSKLEKADILEMTVKHLRNLQRLQMTGVNTEVRTRLLGHLAACVSQINAVNFYTPHPGALRLGQTGTQIPAASAPQMPCKSGSAMHASSEALKLYGGFQVVPTPDGQFAFLVPSAAVMPLGAQNSHHVSPVAPPVTSDSVWRP